MAGEVLKSKLTSVLILCVFLSCAMIGCGQKGPSPRAIAQPLVFGVVAALGSIEETDSLKAVQMAAEEINARAGVSVGGIKRPIEIVFADTRNHEAEVPVNDCLAGLEKVITEKKAHGIVSGTFRSEVLLASFDLCTKYKMPYITNIAMTPKFEKKFSQDRET